MINKNNISIDAFEETVVIKGKRLHEKRQNHLSYALSKTTNVGCVLEFGVYQGTTINIISEFFHNDTVYGFDSFEGLPEDWFTDTHSLKWPAGHFKTDIPYVNKNVKLVQGWFNDSLPTWIEEYKNTPIKFLHIDCDLYSSTKTVLTLLNLQIVPGTIIVFDELYNWKNQIKYELWQEGEFKALKEWVETFSREFKVLSRNSYMQCAIQVTK